MNRITTWGPIALASIGVLALASPAEAYKTHGRWSRDAIPVPWHLNTEGMPYTDLAHEAAAQWSTNRQFEFGYTFKGNTRQYRTKSMNIVHMDDGRIGRGADGMTWWNTGRQGRIVWFNTGMQRNKRWTRSRFTSVLTHELGHALGLLHTRDNSAIMWFSGGPTKIQADDIAGARSLYPPTGRPRTWETNQGGDTTPQPPGGKVGKPSGLTARGTSTLRPTLAWRPADNAVKYRVAIDAVGADGKQTRALRSNPVDGNLFRPHQPLPQTGRYLFWVRGIGADGTEGEWANGSFELSQPTQKPGKATVTGPQALVEVLTPTVTFDPAEHAEGHDVFVDRLASGDSPRAKLVRLESVVGNRVDLPALEPGARYRVWVRGRNALGAGSWSSGYSFQVSEDATEADDGLPLPPTTPISNDPPADDGFAPQPPTTFNPPATFDRPPTQPRTRPNCRCPRCNKPRCNGRRRGFLGLFGR